MCNCRCDQSIVEISKNKMISKILLSIFTKFEIVINIPIEIFYRSRNCFSINRSFV